MAIPKIRDAAAEETGPVSQNPELDRILRYFDGTHKARRFDGYGRRDDHSFYYRPDVHPESDRTRACVSVEWVAFAEIAKALGMDPDSQVWNMDYLPCGISSGIRAHELIDQKNNANRNLGHDLSVSTYKADEYLGLPIHKKMVIAPNKKANLDRADIIGNTRRDKMIIAPVVREGAIRELTRTGAFSRWQRYEEEDFMAFWYPVIDRCKGMVLDGDWNFSRNSIWEMMRGVLIQSGHIPSRPKADMDVCDLDGNLMTLLARTEKLAQTLKYQLGKGFEAREAATALAQIFTIDDDIRSGAIPAGSLHPVLRNRPPAELDAMDRLKAELKPVILKHCAHYMRLNDLPAEYRDAAKHAPQELPPELQEAYKKFGDDISKGENFEYRVGRLYAALNAQGVSDEHRQDILVQLGRAYGSEKVPSDILTDRGKLEEFIRNEHGRTDDPVQEFLDRFQSGLAEGNPLKTYTNPTGWLNIVSVLPSEELKARHAETEPAPRRVFDSHERFFEKRAQALMFEDNLYGKLSQWEQLALPFAIGATETGLYPAAKPMATMVFTDLKRGAKGFERAQKAGVHDMNELAGALGREIGHVIEDNAREAEELKARLKADSPGKVVVNTLSFLRIADTIEHFRKTGGGLTMATRFIAAPGASETSPQMRLALQMKYMDRSVDRAVFQNGWQHSNDLVQLRVRARMIQAGLVERPAKQSALRVYTDKPKTSGTPDPLKTPESLLDDIRLLADEVDRARKANVRAPEQALALARLITLHELLVDENLQHGGGKATRDLIKPSADVLMSCYDLEKAKAITERAKDILTDRETGVAWWIPRERLYVDPDPDDDDDRKAAKVVQNRRMDDYLKAQDSQKGKMAIALQRPGTDETQIKSGGAQR